MIAISYRREDSLPIAGRLYDRLQAKFGKKNVFMDFDSIPPGMDFREQIRQMIEKANLVVAIIGPHWLGEQPDASRRIDNPVDFVRLEIAYALERGIPVIPLLINNTQMPKSEMLPPNIQELAFRQALPLDSGMDFHNHTDRLIAGIGKATDAERKQRRFISDSREPRPANPAIDVPRASGDREEPKRKQIAWTWSKRVVGTSVVLLFVVVALAARYVATHQREAVKQVATANEPRSDRSVPPVSHSTPPEQPPVSIARSEKPSSPVPKPPATPAGPNIKANAVYEGTIHAKNDSSTNVPLVITIGSDLKSGTMTQNSQRGDVVVKFAGVWEGPTLRAVTNEVVSVPNGIKWEPESFALRLANDSKSATYECVADGKTYVAELSAEASPVVRAAPIYKGTIRVQGDKGSGTPLTINFAANRKSGTMTQTSKSGDTVVRFTGTWDGTALHALTDEVISRPKNVQWKPESFTLRFVEDGKRGSYECNSEGHVYTAELSSP